MRKAEWNRFHFKRRMEDKYGIKITNRQYQQFVEQVKSGKAEFLRKQENGRGVFIIVFREKHIPVVYCNKQQNLVTVLRNAVNWVHPPAEYR